MRGLYEFITTVMTTLLGAMISHTPTVIQVLTTFNFYTMVAGGLEYVTWVGYVNLLQQNDLVTLPTFHYFTHSYSLV